MWRLFCCAIAASAAATPAPAASPPYMDAALPIPSRVSDLLSRMTRAELIHQTWHPEPQSPAVFASVCAAGLGGTEAPGGGTPLARIRARNALQQACMAAQPHAIPVSFHQEGLHSGAVGGTIFPEPLLTACTWNVSLAQSIGAALAYEARGAGVDNVWSPVVNMWTDDRFGRFQEGFSPDPAITSAFARAMVLGLQGGASGCNDPLPGGPNASVWATAKHFAGYGSAAGGLNGGPFQLSNRTLFEHYLRPWRAMAALGLRGAMPSHNSVLDVPMHGNRWLTRSVLRGEFGGGNMSLVSDCNDIAAMQFYRVAANLSRNTGLAMRAGVDADLQCGPLGAGGLQDQAYFAHIEEAIADGFATEGDLRELAGHVLTQKFAAGLFEQPLADEAGVARLDAPQNRRLAYEAAAQGIVLLQNNGVLPIDFARARRVALIGPQMSCDAAGEGASSPKGGCAARLNMLGSYILDDGSVAAPLLPDAFNSTLPGVAVTVAPGCAIDGDPRLDLIPAAVAAAAAADVAIVAVGDSLASCGEWADRDSLDLPGGQLALLAALANTSTPLVVVLINGRAASFGPGNALLGKFAAVLEAWRPGEEGAQALLDIVRGAVVPSGKLANQWAQHVGQMGSGAQPWLARRRAKWVANARSPADPTDGRVYDPYVASQFSSLPLFRFVRAPPSPWGGGGACAWWLAGGPNAHALPPHPTPPPNTHTHTPTHAGARALLRQLLLQVYFAERARAHRLPARRRRLLRARRAGLPRCA